MSYSNLHYPWIKDFTNLLSHLKTLPIWKQMEETVEDSPWHREKNVAVHTEMALEEAISFIQKYSLSSSDAKKVLLAILFHDFGKPKSEQIKTNDETGKIYRQYAGHEKVSARLFEHIFVENYKAWFSDWVSPEEAYAITFLIEHHLPYKITDKAKRKMYGIALSNMLDSRNAFYAMIQSDTWGRISDDQDAKKQAVLDWITEFERYTQNQVTDKIASIENRPVVMFMVGPSGAGKTTVVNTSKMLGFKSYSWDDLRVECYKKHLDAANAELIEQELIEQELIEQELEDLVSLDGLSDGEVYHKAFQYCSNNEKEFTKFQQDAFRDLLDSKVNIIVDNTNLTRKRRAALLQMAKQKKYVTMAYKQTSLSMLYRRAASRTDKKVPLDAIEYQFNNIDVPIIGEFDDVVIDKANFY